MVKGFKRDGKFHPTGRKKSMLSSGNIKFKKPVTFRDDEFVKKKLRDIPEQKVTDIVTFDELDESAKEKAREWVRSWITDDNWYAEDEGILYDVDSKPQFAGHDVFKNSIPKYWDLDRDSYINFELEFKEGGEKKLLNYLGLSDSLEKKIQATFENGHTNSNYNTQIKFHDVMGNEIDTDADYDEYVKYLDEDEDRITEKEFDVLQKGVQKWDDLMDKSFRNLRSNFEYTLSDEGVDDMIRSNEYTFDRMGNREDA